MTFAEITRQAGTFITRNSPTILTGLAVAGTVTTAYLSGKAGFKAARVIEEHEVSPVGGVRDELTTREKFEYTWKLYVPAAGAGVITVAAIIASNRIGTRRAAAVASALAISERALTEYQDKVVEKIGTSKERAVRDEIAQDRVTNNPPTREIIIDATESLIYDTYSDRYFRSSIEDVKQGINALNHQILHDNYASLNDFYAKIGLRSVSMGDELGWNTDSVVELVFSATITEDKRPCIVINFAKPPKANYYRFG